MLTGEGGGVGVGVFGCAGVDVRGRGWRVGIHRGLVVLDSRWCVGMGDEDGERVAV